MRKEARFALVVLRDCQNAAGDQGYRGERKGKNYRRARF